MNENFEVFENKHSSNLAPSEKVQFTVSDSGAICGIFLRFCKKGQYRFARYYCDLATLVDYVLKSMTIGCLNP